MPLKLATAKYGLLMVVLLTVTSNYSFHRMFWSSTADIELAFWESMERLRLGNDNNMIHGRNMANMIQRDQRTLALLYPQGLTGGYRNQVIRFMGLCRYAIDNNYTQLYLPSLLWTTVIHNGTEKQNRPIPMDWIFDIDHWNRVANEPGVKLPRIVGGDFGDESDCWDTNLFTELNLSKFGPLVEASFARGSLSPAAAEIQESLENGGSMYKMRRMDLSPRVRHCQHPAAFGGGRMIGKLWNTMMEFRRSRRRSALSFDHDILRSLKPARKWRELASSCLASHNASKYVALHPRVEIDMLTHPCGNGMEKNLTKILEQVHDLVEENKKSVPGVNAVFVAVASGLLHSEKMKGRLREHSEHNADTFEDYTNMGHLSPDPKLLGEHQLRIFNCGERWLQHYYEKNPMVPNHGSLLQAVIDFDLAVNSSMFVGTNQSSFSIDVLTSRYHFGKGNTNYRYTRYGRVENVSNGGLPKPHTNCK